MEQEYKQLTLKSEVLALDDVVVTLDGGVQTVARTIRSRDFPLHTLNYRLLALRPSDLDNPGVMRDKIRRAISDTEAGLFDAMFARAAALHDQAAPLADPYNLREDSLTFLRNLLADERALSELVNAGKTAVAQAHAIRIRPTPDEQLQQLARKLQASTSPITEGLDRIFTAEKIPFVLFSHPNYDAWSLAEADHHLTPDDANHVYVSDEFLSLQGKAQAFNTLIGTQILFDQVLSRRLGLLEGDAIRHVPGADFQKMKYQLERKRSDLSTQFKRGGNIRLFMDEQAAAQLRLNSDPRDNLERNFHDAASTMAELHHLLRHFNDPKDQETVRLRFDHAVAFHDRVMGEIDRKIEERLQSTRLPPPRQHEHAIEDQEPVTAEEAVARANQFAESHLPSHYRLRALFQPAPDHPIVLRLTDDAGHTVETTIKTFEPNAMRALEIKQRVQAHLLDVPGIVPYRGPTNEGGFHIDDDELIPASGFTSRIVPKYGDYRLKLKWNDPKAEMYLSLGLTYMADNRAEAERRAAFVLEKLETARQTRKADGLALTRSDLADTLKDHVRQQGDRWDDLTHGPIDHFPTSFRFAFAKQGHDQDSWLQIDSLRTDGNPNLTWTLPIHIYVNGHKISNASTQVNLHVQDRHTAEIRARETVQRLLDLTAAFPSNTRWAIDAEHPTRLTHLSEAARAASPDMLDMNRFIDIQNELRSPYRQDLTVRLAEFPHQEDGQSRFALEIIRGSAHGQAQPILERTGDDTPPAIVRRQFVIAEGADPGIAHQFAESVNRTFREVIREEYDPRSNRNFDKERLQKRKTPRKFSPDFAPAVLNDAISAHAVEFPGIQPIDTLAHGSRARMAAGRTIGR